MEMKIESTWEIEYTGKYSAGSVGIQLFTENRYMEVLYGRKDLIILWEALIAINDFNTHFCNIHLIYTSLQHTSIHTSVTHTHTHTHTHT